MTELVPAFVVYVTAIYKPYIRKRFSCAKILILESETGFFDTNI